MARRRFRGDSSHVAGEVPAVRPARPRVHPGEPFGHRRPPSGGIQGAPDRRALSGAWSGQRSSRMPGGGRLDGPRPAGKPPRNGADAWESGESTRPPGPRRLSCAPDALADRGTFWQSVDQSPVRDRPIGLEHRDPSDLVLDAQDENLALDAGDPTAAQIARHHQLAADQRLRIVSLGESRAARPDPVGTQIDLEHQGRRPGAFVPATGTHGSDPEGRRQGTLGHGLSPFRGSCRRGIDRPGPAPRVPGTGCSAPGP